MSERKVLRAPSPARERVDPKIRSRRIEVARARGRRRLRVLATLVVVALVAAAAYGLAQSPLLAVDEIVVTGADRADVDEIRVASGIDPGDPILFTDLSAAARRIESVPWVESARVRRSLPRTVAIEVTERVPVAWMRDVDGAVALVDGSARLLDLVPEPPALPAVTGLEVDPFVAGSVARPAALVGLLVEMPTALSARVVEVVRADEAGVLGAVLVLADGPEVRLGTLDQLAEKASAALAVLAALEGEDPAYLDVSVPLAPTTG